jgi:hypothetical protein
VDVLELLGEPGLADLALVALHAVPRAVLRVEVLDELHRQGRAALDGLVALDVLERRADHALEVDALVAVEALVLDGHRGLLHHVGDRGRRDRLAQDPGLDDPEPGLAVRGVDDAVLAGVLGLQAVDGRRGARHGDDPADRAQGGDRPDRP